MYRALPRDLVEAVGESESVLRYSRCFRLVQVLLPLARQAGFAVAKAEWAPVETERPAASAQGSEQESAELQPMKSSADSKYSEA
jgi:hypothetical protein